LKILKNNGMPSFLLTLIKINLVLAFFVMAYFLILRRLTFYSLNRLFLVFGILFSSLYPFIDLTDLFYSQQQIVAFVPAINEKVTRFGLSNFIITYWPYIRLLLYAGIVVMAIRLTLQFITLYKLHKSSAPDLVDNVPVRRLKELVSPFSFWQTIYINPSLHQEKDLKSILAHEHIHIRQWHTLDILLAELSVVFYWFNPGVWLMKKAIKENLEFITDEKVLKTGIDKKAYQYSLLDVGNLAASNRLTNSFTISDLKKRIRMMNARRSSRLTLSRYALVVPVLLLITLLSTVSKREIKEYFASVEPVVYLDNSNTANSVPATATKKQADKVTKLRITQAGALPNSIQILNKPDDDMAGSRAVTSVPVRAITLGEVKGIARDTRYNSIGSPSSINQPVTNGNKDKNDEVVVVGYARPITPKRVQGFPVNPRSDSSTISTFLKPEVTVQGYPTRPTLRLKND
jgi:hypothetical protein